MKTISHRERELNYKTLSVLIAERNNSVRESLQIGLKQFNCQIIAVSTASEAIFRLKKQRVHVLLTELILPQGSGFDVLRLVQEHRAEWGGFPYVMVVTGMDSPEYETQAEELGADEFIPKPVTINEIIKQLTAFERTLVHTDKGLQMPRSRMRCEAEITKRDMRTTNT
jgi:DNA-binding response OmpR family regulator